jgi:hypothetical protein
VNWSEILVVLIRTGTPSSHHRLISVDNMATRTASNLGYNSYHFLFQSYFNFPSLWFVFPLRAWGFPTYSHLLGMKLWQVKRSHSKKIFIIQFSPICKHPATLFGYLLFLMIKVPLFTATCFGIKYHLQAISNVCQQLGSEIIKN